MEKPVERPFGRTIGIAVVAVLVALVAAVSAFALVGSTATAENPAAGPADTRLVQDSQATPTPEQERAAPGDREDCPEKDGSAQEDESAAPDTATPSQEL